MRHTARILAASLAAVLITTMAAQAQNALDGLAPPPMTQPLQQGAPNQQGPRVQAVADDRVAFNTAEQWLIPNFYTLTRDKQKRAARSKKFDRNLPAGLAANPNKGDTLAPAVLAELARLPGPLIRDLPPRRPDTDRVIVGKNVLMVRLSTGEVLDILPNILY